MPCRVIDDSILSRDASRPWGRNTAVKFAHREQHWCLPRDFSSLPSNTEATYYYGFKQIPVTSWNNHVWQKSPVSSEQFLCRKFEIPLRMDLLIFPSLNCIIFFILLSISRCLEMPSDLNQFPSRCALCSASALAHPLLNPQQRPLTWGTHQASRHSNRRHKDFQLVYILRSCFSVCFMLKLPIFSWKKITLCVFKRFVTSPEKNTTEFGGLVNASGPRSTSLQFYTSKTLILRKEMCQSGWRRSRARAGKLRRMWELAWKPT